MPQHAAQIEAIKGVITGDWHYSELFEITYLTPYWLGYALVLLLSLPFGAVLASKLVVAFALCAYPLAARAFCERMGVNPWLGWLLIPLPFGFAYEWGFLNFLVAAPFAYLFLVSAVFPDDDGQRLRWLKTATWIHFLFFAHILIAGFFMLVAAILIARHSDSFRGWLGRAWPLLTIVPVATAYVVFTLANANLVSAPILWDINPARGIALVQALMSAPTWPAGLALGAMAVAAPFLLGYRPHRHPALWAPFLVYVAWMLFAPHFVFGNAYTYHRFGFFGLPLYFICFDYGARKDVLAERARRCVQVGFVAIALSMIAWQAIRSASFETEYRDYKELIAHAEPGKRVLSLPVDRYSRVSNAPLYLHFPLWYQAETRGLVDFSFASLFVIIQYKDKLAHPIQPGFEWNPTSFDWNRHDGTSYDYFIVRSHLDPVSWMMDRTGCRVALTKHAGDWWLFERIVPEQAGGCPPG